MDQPRAFLPDWVWSMLSGLIAIAALAIFLVVGYLAGLRAMDYGWGFFVSLPVFVGFAASILLDLPRHYDFGQHAITSFWTSFFGLLFAFIALKEGALCLLMAFPLLFLATMAGTGLAYGLMKAIRRRQGKILVSALVLLPFAVNVDRLRPATPPTRTISTVMTIHATPDKIWPLLFRMDQLPPAEFWMFRMGVANPQSIRTDRLGLGGNRWCVLSTGEMPEKIVEYEAPRRFTFRVLRTPPSMREWNPFGEAETPHLRGYFECESGGFELIPLPNGETRLVGVTRYSHFYSPSAYWNLWTDKIVREVQWRVMSEIKRRVEQ